MKILRVIPTMDPSSGGPCSGIRNVIPELNKLGVINEVVSMDAPGKSFLGKDTFTIHALGPAKGGWQYSSKLIPWLIDNFNRFDVIIVHGLWLYHGYAVLKALNKFRGKFKADNLHTQILPRLYVMPHGMLDPYFQKAPERKWKALRNTIYWQFIERHLINGAHGILFTCEQELKLAREPFRPYKPKKEINIGYGIGAPPVYQPDMTAAFNNHCPELKGARYLLFLSRVHQKKGLDLLVKAYKTLADQHTDLPKLVIAGPGLETEFGKKMQQLVNADAYLKNSVFFTGMLTGAAKWGAYYGCDAFVLPSHQENFGIAVAEALACGKPVLISDQVNIWREIKGGGIVGSDDLEGVKEIIYKWLKLSIRDKEFMAQNAWDVYHNNFESFPAAQKLFKVLNAVTNPETAQQESGESYSVVTE